MSDKMTFILQGNGTLFNRGCDAILRSTVQILQEGFGVCNFINCPSYSVPGDGRQISSSGIVHVTRWSPHWIAHQVKKKILKREKELVESFVNKAAAVLAVGGDNYSLDYGLPLPFFNANRAVLEHHKPLILWGASVGPFDKDPDFEKWAKKELERVTLICARESETTAYLDGLGIRDNVREMSDPAFVLEPSPVKLAEPETRLLDSPHIGVNLSPILGAYRQDESSWADMATECVKRMLQLFDMPLALIPHVSYPGNDDHEFMQNVLNRLPDFKDRLLLLNNCYNSQELKWIISHLAVFVGARTHATIAALSSNVPTCSIGYSMKAKGINKDIFGHCDWLLPVNELSADSFVEKVGSLIDKKDEVRAYLDEIMPGYKRRAMLGIDYVREALAAVDS